MRAVADSVGDLRRRRDVLYAQVAPASQRALDFLLAFAVGGTYSDWDGRLLCVAASWFATRDLAVPSRFAPRPMASIPRLKPEDWVLEGVDTHVGSFSKKRAPIWDVMFEIDPDLEEEDFGALENWMMLKRSMVNERYDHGNARKNNPEWHDTADEAARRIIAAAVVKKPPW